MNDIFFLVFFENIFFVVGNLHGIEKLNHHAMGLEVLNMFGEVGGNSPSFRTGDSQLGLTKHNALRELHENTPAMVWDDSLCDAAQAHADVMADTDTFFHNSAELNSLGHGENLAFASSTNGPSIDYDSQVQLWYDEIGLYDYENPGFSGATGHFTQVVWAGSINLCMRHAFDATGTKIYYVARYTARGNMMNSFETNVMPLKATDGTTSTTTTATTTVTTGDGTPSEELGLAKHNG